MAAAMALLPTPNRYKLGVSQSDRIGEESDMSKILLIDDDAAFRMLVTLWLTRAGHQVVSASNGRHGVQLAHEQDFDVVVTDIVMPEQEGIETILTLRRNGMHAPILAMSGGGSLDNTFYLRSAQALGANDTIAKPFTAGDLTAKVTLLLEAHMVAPLMSLNVQEAS
jgi:DNA-binding response OmpR family regulator